MQTKLIDIERRPRNEMHKKCTLPVSEVTSIFVINPNLEM